MKISVLGIGSELTSGQVLNRNGQWISLQVRNLGIPTSAHLVVPDEEDLILESLQFCAAHSDMIFVTGGLGPTSDDFTRQVIAKWTGKKLFWSEESWAHIQERLKSRGVVPKDIQKQQCYFPEGSEVLKNSAGTANAFSLEFQGKEVFVLPGPPKEIEAIWKDHVDSRLQRKFQNQDPLITRSWDTLGWGESEIAEKAEAALEGCTFEKGYRVHYPYVEFKLTFLKSQLSQAGKWISAVDQALKPMTVLRDNQDAAQELASVLSQFENVWLIDEMPGSFLMNRLFPFSKKLLKDQKLSFSPKPVSVPTGSFLVLHLRQVGPGTARVSWAMNGQEKSEDLPSPYQSSLMKERAEQYFAEMAMIFWMKTLSSHSPS